MRNIFALLALLTVAACVNPYQKFYEPYIQESDFKTSQRFILNEGPPDIEYIDEREREAREKALYEDSFTPVGVASFNGDNTNESLIVAQGKAVKAFKVLVSKTYTDTQTRVLEQTTPTTQTTYHGGSIYGSGGYGTYSGTSTTYGTTTTRTPYQVRRYDHTATFWIKRRKGGLGATIGEPSPEARQRNQANKGVMIYTLIKGEAAYEADFLENDVIIRIGSVSPITIENVFSALQKYYGTQNVEFEFYRNGNLMTKMINLPDQYIYE